MLSFKFDGPLPRGSWDEDNLYNDYDTKGTQLKWATKTPERVYVSLLFGFFPKQFAYQATPYAQPEGEEKGNEEIQSNFVSKSAT